MIYKANLTQVQAHHIAKMLNRKYGSWTAHVSGRGNNKYKVIINGLLESYLSYTY